MTPPAQAGGVFFYGLTDVSVVTAGAFLGARRRWLKVMDAFTASELLVNDEVRQALEAGLLMPNTWALRGLNDREQRFELSTKQLEKLVFDDSEGCFNNGKPDDGRIALSFMR